MAKRDLSWLQSKIVNRVSKRKAVSIPHQRGKKACSLSERCPHTLSFLHGGTLKHSQPNSGFGRPQNRASLLVLLLSQACDVPAPSIHHNLKKAFIANWESLLRRQAADACAFEGGAACVLWAFDTWPRLGSSCDWSLIGFGL